MGSAPALCEKCEPGGLKLPTMKVSPAGKTVVVQSWGFAGNTYGQLSLVQDQDGDFFLQMEDCFGPSDSRQLDKVEVAAFKLLAEID